MEQASKSSRHREHPSKINKNRSMPPHLIVKLTSLSDKEKILKAAWDKRSGNTTVEILDCKKTYPQRPGRPERTSMIYPEH